MAKRESERRRERQSAGGGGRELVGEWPVLSAVRPSPKTQWLFGLHERQCINNRTRVLPLLLHGHTAKASSQPAPREGLRRPVTLADPPSLRYPPSRSGLYRLQRPGAP